MLVSVFGVRELLSVNQPVGEEYRKLAEQLLSDARIKFETIRGVSVREVPLEVVNQSWVAETWGTPSESEQIELQREDNIYKALFLIPQDYSMYDAQLDWTTSFRAAKWQGKIYVVQENFDVTETTRATGTFVHELTHIMQEGYSLSARATFDGNKALSSLKEGDATLMADTLKNGEVVPVSYAAAADEQGLSLEFTSLLVDGLELALPDTIDDLNRFVYRYGLDFVKTLYSQGGWSTIDTAYANPPTDRKSVV